MRIPILGDMFNKTEAIENKEVEQKQESVELERKTPISVLSVARQYQFNFEFLTPQYVDRLYATVPELSRSVDIRGSAIISQGYGVLPRTEEKESQKAAALCDSILKKSGGVTFIEQWNKNTDAYGDGFVEMVQDDDGKVTRLAHIHPDNFGFELEKYEDPESGETKTRVKLDKDTQEPVGYATYTYNEQEDIYENETKIDKDKIAHLKYKVLGDSLYGISMYQPAYDSIIRKLEMEDYISSAGRLVAAPKIVISGNFPTEEDLRKEAKEAASLDTSDVVVLDQDNNQSFEIVNPGTTNLPELREVFITNIISSTGIPRPILTSESSEINKATMQELMKHLRENMRSNMNKMKNVIETKIFEKILDSYGIDTKHVPIFYFPEDPESEEEVVTREQKKATTLTSLSNNITILKSMFDQPNDVVNENKEKISEILEKTIDTYNQTLNTFRVNNDKEALKREKDFEPPTSTGEDKNQDKAQEESAEPVETTDNPSSIYVPEETTLVDDPESLKDPDTLKRRHDDLHAIFNLISTGIDVKDSVTGEFITLPQVHQKHRYYIKQMENIGLVHNYLEDEDNLDRLLR